MKHKLTTWPTHISKETWAVLLTALGLLFVAPYILAASSFVLWEALGDGVGARANSALTPLYILFFIGQQLVFLNAKVYVAASVVGILLALSVLVWGPHRRWLRVWAALTALAIVAFPIAFRYQPSLAAAPGYRLINATQPGLVDGVVKSAQRALEVSTCVYELLGWDSANQLYYRSACGETSQLWHFAPATMMASETVTAIPGNLSRIELSREATLALVRAADARPKGIETMARGMHLNSNGLVSSDGHWTALITQELYGPYNVVIVTAED